MYIAIASGVKVLKGLHYFLVSILFLVGCSAGFSEQGKDKTKNKIDTNDVQSAKQSGPKNILLIGIDSRGEKKSHSDSIMIVRYDKNEQSLKLASIMRDSYVEIPNYSKKQNKINHAYFLGGSELLQETIQTNFGIKTDSVAIIDFHGFKKAIDMIAPDGIEVEITEKMIEDMKFDLKPGKQKIFADDLLKYVRFRHDEKSDFGRVQRQQNVLISLKDEAVKQFGKVDGITKFPKIFEEVYKHIQTDLSWDELFYMSTALVFHPIKEVKTIRIPVEDSFENKSFKHSGAVLKMNLDENVEALEHFFNEEEKVDKAS